MLQLIARNFLGKSPLWYKYTILSFLFLNPLVFFFISPFIAGWLILLEFIFTLALALQAYPIAAGGLLALQAAAIGLSKPETIYAEIVANLPTLLLLIFMVAGIYYLKDVLSLIFTWLFLKFRKKWQDYRCNMATMNLPINTHILMALKASGPSPRRALCVLEGWQNTLFTFI